MIKEITKFIANKASLTVGTNIYVGNRPQDAADICDVTLETGGGETFFDLDDRIDMIIQVLSRAKTYQTARARAYAIYDAIFGSITAGSANWTLPVIDAAYEAMIIEPLAPPQFIGQDEKRRFEFSTNYLMKIKKL